MRQTSILKEVTPDTEIMGKACIIAQVYNTENNQVHTEALPTFLSPLVSCKTSNHTVETNLLGKAERRNIWTKFIRFCEISPIFLTWSGFLFPVLFLSKPKGYCMIQSITRGNKNFVFKLLGAQLFGQHSHNSDK